MKCHDAGSSDSSTQDHSDPLLGERHGNPWDLILSTLTGGKPLRAVQKLAIDEAKVLHSRQHLVVCAPTNSGKTVVGHVVLLDALMRGRRALLLEPLRALAQEKADELTGIFEQLSPGVFPSPPLVRLTTGDYRLDAEEPGAPPPKQGELVVATPERLEAILRNPEYASWISHVGAVVVDEAHLVGDARRGPTLELLIASLLSLPAPPRLALLSATIGNPQRLQGWLQPCHLLQSSLRTPLKKEVWGLEPKESTDDVLTDALRQLLEQPDTAALVFVYRKSSAEALAARLTVNLGQRVLAYHSGQSQAERRSRKEAFLTGECRCVVSTTALAMGMNLPVTHVFLRDTTFFGSGKLQVDQILQILGRAGRGQRAGTGVVLVRAEDDWEAEELAQSLSSERIQPVRSVFERVAEDRGRGRSKNGSGDDTVGASTVVASCLSRHDLAGMTPEEIRALLRNTLAGNALADRADQALVWLASPERHLAYIDDDGRCHLTVLGRAGVRSMLPLPMIAGVGQLIRDLLSLAPEGDLLRRWSGIDHLFVVSLLSDRGPKLRRFSEALASQIDAWHESRPQHEKSLLFAEWVAGSATASKADELLGSLGVQPPAKPRRERPRPQVDGRRREAELQSSLKQIRPSEGARSRCYVTMLAAIVLHERASGTPIADLEARWSIAGLEGPEESWRDTALWLLSGQAALFELRAYYHHLREHCNVGPDNLKQLKRELRRIQHAAYELMDRIKYCTPLGGLHRGLRNLYAREGGRTAGIGTIRKLEESGIVSLGQIAQMSLADLMNVGIQRTYALQIRRYVERRLR